MTYDDFSKLRTFHSDSVKTSIENPDPMLCVDGLYPKIKTGGYQERT